jgi:phosphoglycerate kinase
LGLLEEEKFRHASVALAKAIASRASGRAMGIAGGGETLYAIDLSKMGKYFDFISTGGGAMLTFLEGTTLSGLKPLIC